MYWHFQSNQYYFIRLRTVALDRYSKAFLKFHTITIHSITPSTSCNAYKTFPPNNVLENFGFVKLNKILYEYFACKIFLTKIDRYLLISLRFYFR